MIPKGSQIILRIVPDVTSFVSKQIYNYRNAKRNEVCQQTRYSYDSWQ